MANPSTPELFSVFDINHSGPITTLIPKKEHLPSIMQNWRTGAFNFGRFLRKLSALHAAGHCNKWVRFMDHNGGFADYYLFRDDLYGMFYHRLNWGMSHLAFCISGYYVLRMQLAGEMREQLVGDAINQVQSGTLFHGDLSADYSLKWDKDTDVSHASIIFTKDLIKDEIQLDTKTVYRCQNNPDTTLAIYPFPLTSQIHDIAQKIMNLEPKEPMPLLRAESWVMEILTQSFLQLHNCDSQLEGLQLRDADITALKKVQKCLEQNYATDITLASLCKDVGLNRKKLNLGFQLLFGSTVGEYLTKKRMSVAKELLKAGHNTTVVALEVGYNNRSGFSEAFKRNVGCSPKQFLA